MARPGPSRGQLHVGRYFAFLLVIFVALYSDVAFGGAHHGFRHPKLGLDLKGGAQVILTPKSEGGKKPTADQLSAAVDILRNRVDANGVSGADIVVQGSQIVISVPGGNRSSIANVSKAAQLEFRQVLQAENGYLTTPTTTTVPTATPKPGTSAPTTPTATPKATTQAKASGQASPTATSNGRPVSDALVQPRTATSVSPTPQPTSTPKASAGATPAVTPAPLPTPTDAVDATPPIYSGMPYTAAAYAALNCADPTEAAGGYGDPTPTQQIIACGQGGVKYQLDVAKVTGKDIKSAGVTSDPTTGEPEVDLSFKGSGQTRWTDLTKVAYAAGVGTTTNTVAIVLDGVVVTAPTINSIIYGDAQISGGFTTKTAQELANNLKFGALPLTFTAGSAEVISASLGTDQLHSGLLAGGIGLIAVVLYSLLYYRALGFVTIGSLLVSAGLVYASVCDLGAYGFSLSLAGIAGFIVSVGITADSFVVYFERLKDEIKEGRTPRSAVDRGWVRARRTIINADAVSLLAAVVLYFVSIGDVRGFAATLGLSTVLDLVVVFLFTRPLMSFLSRFAWFSRSRPTGFYGPDGGQPSRGGPRTSLGSTPPPSEA